MRDAASRSAGHQADDRAEHVIAGRQLRPIGTTPVRPAASALLVGHDCAGHARERSAVFARPAPAPLTRSRPGPALASRNCRWPWARRTLELRYELAFVGDAEHHRAERQAAAPCTGSADDFVVGRPATARSYRLPQPSTGSARRGEAGRRARAATPARARWRSTARPAGPADRSGRTPPTRASPSDRAARRARRRSSLVSPGLGDDSADDEAAGRDRSCRRAAWPAASARASGRRPWRSRRSGSALTWSPRRADVELDAMLRAVPLVGPRLESDQISSRRSRARSARTRCDRTASASSTPLVTPARLSIPASSSSELRNRLAVGSANVVLAPNRSPKSSGLTT